jgi:opacity protein-like surface antigen
MKKVKSLILFLVLFTSICSYSQTPFRGNLTIGMTNPIGDFSKLYKGNVSAEAGIFYSLPLISLDLTFTAGYNGYKYKNDYFTGLVSSNLNGATVSNFNVSWTATDIPIMVGARLRFPFGNMRPYVTGEVGLHLVSFTDRFNGQRIIGNSGSPVAFNFNGATESGSSIGVGTAIGAGLEIPLIIKVNLDLNVKYNYSGVTYSKSYNVFQNNNSQFTTAEMKNINYITLRGGVVIDF